MAFLSHKRAAVLANGQAEMITEWPRRIHRRFGGARAQLPLCFRQDIPVKEMLPFLDPTRSGGLPPVTRCFQSVLFAACLSLGVFGAARADNWPSWRGTDNNAVSKETRLPAVFGVDKNLAWKLNLPGLAGSTPAIWGDRIFLTSGDNDGKDLVLLCVKTDGNVLWKKVVGHADKIMIKGDEGNEASPSPSTDGTHVFCFFGTGILACFDFDGKEIWKFNVQDRYSKFSIYHGIHNTPLLVGDRLYLSLQHTNGHWLAALDKNTGKEVWKFERKTDAKGESMQCYTSPCLWSDGKASYIVINGCDYATAHSLKDGSEVWRLGGLNAQPYRTDFRVIASPVATPEMILVPTARNYQVVALKPSASGTVSAGSPFEIWRLPKGAPDVPTPVVQGGLVYLCGESGILTCVDALTGKMVYAERLIIDRYRASPVFADGKIFCINRGNRADGAVVSVVKAGRQFELLAANHLPDEITASPAVSGGRVYIRGFRTIYAFEEKGK
jgi:outer membrane protein assembly factor BamB